MNSRPRIHVGNYLMEGMGKGFADFRLKLGRDEMGRLVYSIVPSQFLDPQMTFWVRDSERLAECDHGNDQA